jgi:hypothetical protein
MIQTNHQRLSSDGWVWDPQTRRYQDPQTGDWLDERAATERAFWRDWVKKATVVPMRTEQLRLFEE